MREIIDEINRKYKDTEQLAGMKTGEIFPTNVAPIIAVSGPELMAWGFPMQGKSQTIINARSKTAFEKPMFSKALNDRERDAWISDGAFTREALRREQPELVATMGDEAGQMSLEIFTIQ